MPDDEIVTAYCGITTVGVQVNDLLANRGKQVVDHL
jgi:hypothetical protein